MTNRNDRGSAHSRRSLKCWMLAEFGDGITVDCAFCGKRLFYSQFTKDRFPKPGRKGGKYIRGNVRPACFSCNSSEGAREAAVERAQAKLRRDKINARRREIYALRQRIQSRFHAPIHDLDFHEILDFIQLSTDSSTCE